VANGRKRKQTIYSLEDGVNHITGIENLLKHASDYYKQLFGPGVGNVVVIDNNMWHVDDLVTEEENEIVTKPFSEEKVKRALF
jgi:hypothetical protein